MSRTPSGDTRHDPDDRRNVVKSELRWIAVVAFVLSSLLGVIVVTSYRHMLHPPSSEQRVASDSLHLNGEFVERNLGTEARSDGRIVVRIVATRFTFVPECVPVPAGRPFLLRVASSDVVHGLLVDGTNINTMVVPHDVSVVTSRIDTPGDYRMPCHEYCGLGHSEMVGQVRVVPAEAWRAPATPDARLSCVARTAASRPMADLSLDESR